MFYFLKPSDHLTFVRAKFFVSESKSVLVCPESIS